MKNKISNQLYIISFIFFISVIIFSCNGHKQKSDEVKKPNIEWVHIPAGIFIMGSPLEEVNRNEDETPYMVTLDSFKMSTYEISFEQYDVFCDATGREKPNDWGWGRGKNPVINVSWVDASAFAEWLGCRLPTEAEWEYACRAGTTTPFNTGENLTTSQANYDGEYPYNDNPKGENRQKTLAVGSFKPNAWGLHDMHGNVCEWCSDWYDTYPSEKATNPKGPEKGKQKVFRGGHYSGTALGCRSAFRDCKNQDYKAQFMGFRLVSNY